METVTGLLRVTAVGAENSEGLSRGMRFQAATIPPPIAAFHYRANRKMVWTILRPIR
jgi:hypothetical protein